MHLSLKLYWGLLRKKYNFPEKTKQVIRETAWLVLLAWAFISLLSLFLVGLWYYQGMPPKDLFWGKAVIVCGVVGFFALIMYTMTSDGWFDWDEFLKTCKLVELKPERFGLMSLEEQRSWIRTALTRLGFRIRMIEKQKPTVRRQSKLHTLRESFRVDFWNAMKLEFLPKQTRQAEFFLQD
jgi:hypothetical protein